VIISVSTFIERVAEFGRADAGYGQASKDAGPVCAWARQDISTKAA